MEVRAITHGEATEFRRNLRHGFGGDLEDDFEAGNARFFGVMDHDRTYAAFDAGAMIGTSGAFGFDITVPGGRVAMGGLTVVTVRPTHTRRGVLRAMMEVHLADVRERGEVVSGLWASESSIYGRFGFGLATQRLDVKFDARSIVFSTAGSDDVVRLLDADEASKVIPAIYGDCLDQRAGILARSDAWWKHMHFADLERWRDGASAYRHAVVHREGSAVGYAVYRQKERWNDDLAEGTVRVIELMAVDDHARLACWRFLSEIDLFPMVEYWNCPTDFELPWQVADPRRIKRTLTDALYMRVTDVPAALEARSYGRNGSLVLGIAAEGVISGYRIEVDAGKATCTRTSDESDVRFDIRSLGALYLGASVAGELAHAGLIEGVPEAISLLDSMFSGASAPWCPEVF